MKKTIGVLFAGYGEQFVTMGKDLYDASRQVQDLYEQASMCLDINFVQLCFASSDAEISDIEKGYGAILLFQISLYSQLAQAGLQPDFIAGFGIGEYAAAVASQSLSFVDSLYLLNKYAKNFKNFLQEHPEYAIVALSKGFTKDSLEQLCKELSNSAEQVFIGAQTTEQGFYVAGHRNTIEKIKEYCKKHEIRKVKDISLGHGLHCMLMDPLVQAITPYLFKVDFKSLKFPIITNVDGVYITSPDALESALIRQTNNPLQWEEVMQGFIGCQILLCFGPGKQIAQWAALKYPDKEIYMLQNLDDVKKIQDLLQKESCQSMDEVQGQEHSALQACHIDSNIIAVHHDLTIADQINELPTDYDIDDED